MSLSEWKESTAFDGPRASHQSVLSGDHIYVLGGYSYISNNYKLYDDVQVATVDPAGGIGNGGWKQTKPFSGPRSGHACVVVKDTVYLVGGYGMTGYCADMQYAKIRADGTIDEWKTSNEKLVRPRSNSAILAHVGADGVTSIYVVGGVGEINTKTVHFDDVEFCRLGADGAPGKWNKCTYDFRGGRSAPACFVKSNRLYVIGGWGERVIEDVFGDMQSAPLEKDADIGLWNFDPYSTRIPVYGHTAIVTPDEPVPNEEEVLVIAGNGGEGNYFANIQIATIAPDGASRGWQFSRSQIPLPRWGHTTVSAKSIVYVLGGATKSPTGFEATVHFSTIGRAAK